MAYYMITSLSWNSNPVDDGTSMEQRLHPDALVPTLNGPPPRRNPPVARDNPLHRRGVEWQQQRRARVHVLFATVRHVRLGAPLRINGDLARVQPVLERSKPEEDWGAVAVACRHGTSLHPGEARAGDIEPESTRGYGLGWKRK